jgi:ABC-type transporter Mla subunit MlaD
LTEEFVGIASEMNKTLVEIKRLMKSLENVTANNRYELNKLLKEYRKMSEAVRDLSDYLQRDPSSLFYGK